MWEVLSSTDRDDGLRIREIWPEKAIECRIRRDFTLTLVVVHVAELHEL